MRIEQLITRDVLNLLKERNLVTFKPPQPKTRQVPMGTISKHYPLHEAKGEIGRAHPSRKPEGYRLGNGHAFETARVFGWKSRL